MGRFTNTFGAGSATVLTLFQSGIFENFILCRFSEQFVDFLLQHDPLFGQGPRPPVIQGLPGTDNHADAWLIKPGKSFSRNIALLIESQCPHLSQKSFQFRYILFRYLPLDQNLDSHVFLLVLMQVNRTYINNQTTNNTLFLIPISGVRSKKKYRLLEKRLAALNQSTWQTAADTPPANK
jgi:hypothetical protein